MTSSLSKMDAQLNEINPEKCASSSVPLAPCAEDRSLNVDNGDSNLTLTSPGLVQMAIKTEDKFLLVNQGSDSDTFASSDDENATKPIGEDPPPNLTLPNTPIIPENIVESTPPQLQPSLETSINSHETTNVNKSDPDLNLISASLPIIPKVEPTSQAVEFEPADLEKEDKLNSSNKEGDHKSIGSVSTLTSTEPSRSVKNMEKTIGKIDKSYRKDLCVSPLHDMTQDDPKGADTNKIEQLVNLTSLGPRPVSNESKSTEKLSKTNLWIDSSSDDDDGDDQVATDTVRDQEPELKISFDSCKPQMGQGSNTEEIKQEIHLGQPSKKLNSFFPFSSHDKEHQETTDKNQNNVHELNLTPDPLKKLANAQKTKTFCQGQPSEELNSSLSFSSDDEDDEVATADDFLRGRSGNGMKPQVVTLIKDASGQIIHLPPLPRSTSPHSPLPEKPEPSQLSTNSKFPSQNEKKVGKLFPEMTQVTLQDSLSVKEPQAVTSIKDASGQIIDLPPLPPSTSPPHSPLPKEPEPSQLSTNSKFPPQNKEKVDKFSPEMAPSTQVTSQGFLSVKDKLAQMESKTVAPTAHILNIPTPTQPHMGKSLAANFNPKICPEKQNQVSKPTRSTVVIEKLARARELRQQMEKAPDSKILSKIDTELQKVHHEQKLPDSQKYQVTENDKLILRPFLDQLKTGLLGHVERAKIQDILSKNFDWIVHKVCTDIEKNSTQLSCSPRYKMAKEKLVQGHSASVKPLWSFLNDEVVRPLEEQFKNNICFDPKKFTILTTANDTLLQKISQNFNDENHKKILTKKVSDFTKEVTEMNLEIVKHENVAIEKIVKMGLGHYDKEMEFLLDHQYSVPDKLNQFHQEIFQETIDLFRQACAVKNPDISKGHEEDLKNGMNARKTEFEAKNSDHKKNLEKRLTQLVEAARQHYIETVNAELENLRGRNKYNSKFSLAQEFQGRVDQTGRKQGHDYFKKESLKFPKEIVSPFIENLNKIFDEQHNLTRQQLIIEQDKKAADEERKRREFQEREAREKKQVEEAERKQRESQRKSSASTYQNPMPKTTDSISGGPSTRASIRWESLEPLPRKNIVFHVGLHRTKMGFVEKDGEIKVLYDVYNTLYLKGPTERLVAFTTAEEKHFQQQGTATPFHGLLMKHPVDYVYNIEKQKKKLKFRIEDFIFFMLATLKWEAEMTLGVVLDRCIIVVPQSLNERQRKVVYQAGMVAKFSSVTLINDTHAMALAYSIKNKQKGCQVVTVNTCEGFMDAASFKISEDGLIQVLSVAGHHFQLLPSSWSSYFYNFIAGEAPTNEPFKNCKYILHPHQLKVDQATLILCSESHDNHVKLNFCDGKLASKCMSVDPNYPLLGASYLLAISEFDVDHTIYQNFVTNFECDSQLSFSSFEMKLLQINREDELRLTNKTRGSNFDLPDLEARQKNHFFWSAQLSHAEKIRWLLLDYNCALKLKSNEEVEQNIRETIEKASKQYRQKYSDSTKYFETKTIYNAQTTFYDYYKELL